MAPTMEAAMFIMFNMHACVHMCICMCVGSSPTQPHPHLPTHPPAGYPPNQYKCNYTFDISILFEDLKSVETPPPMGGYVSYWVKSCKITKKLIKLNLIEIIRFSLKTYDL